MNFIELANDCVRQLTPYQPGKPIEELERELGITSSIKLASNENSLGASPKAIEAATLALEKANIYPDGAYYELKQHLSSHLEVNPAQITVGNGSDNLLELIVKSYLQKSHSAVISEFAFLTISIILNSYGIKINVSKARDFAHDVDAMLNAIDDRTRVLFLVNPNNPTGTYTNKNNFKKLLNNTPKQVLIVVDQAYAEYMYQSDYADTLKYLDKYPNLIITRTFSKVYGLAALRIGYCVSSPEIADILNRARLPFNVNTIAAKAACAALHDKQHVSDSLKVNEDGMQQLIQGIIKLNLKYIPSVCNFLTIDVGDGPACYQALLKQGVIVRPLNAYNMPKHIRVTIGTTEENKRFLDAMEQVL